jgi:hypothetical protein
MAFCPKAKEIFTKKQEFLLSLVDKEAHQKHQLHLCHFMLY